MTLHTTLASHAESHKVRRIKLQTRILVKGDHMVNLQFFRPAAHRTDRILFNVSVADASPFRRTFRPKWSFPSSDIDQMHKHTKKTKVKTPEPLPCPFCGKLPFYGRDPFLDKITIECRTGKCPVEVQAFPCHYKTGERFTLEELVANWNRRN